MSFGYVPNDNKLKNIISKIFGWTNLIRRMQAPVLWNMLGLQAHEVVLDLGCGGGYFTFEIAKYTRISLGSDIVPARSWRFKNENFPFFVQANALLLPFRDNSFDKIVLSSVLQMVENDERLLKECHRVLKDNGNIVLSVPVDFILLSNSKRFRKRLQSRFGAHNSAHGYYKETELFSLLEKNNFIIQEVEYAPKWLGSILFESILYLSYIFNLPLTHPLHFVFYPIGYLDRFLSKESKGNELVVKAGKAG